MEIAELPDTFPSDGGFDELNVAPTAASAEDLVRCARTPQATLVARLADPVAREHRHRGQHRNQPPTRPLLKHPL